VLAAARHSSVASATMRLNAVERVVRVKPKLGELCALLSVFLFIT
jgi:hypothetical protein